MSKQFLRSGTSIGANCAEAEFAQSNKDFISKYSINCKPCYSLLITRYLLLIRPLRKRTRSPYGLGPHTSFVEMSITRYSLLITQFLRSSLRDEIGDRDTLKVSEPFRQVEWYDQTFLRCHWFSSDGRKSSP